MKKFCLLILTSLLICLPGCQKSVTSLSIELKEIHSGYIEGYLAKKELPNSLELVPPPPKQDSAEFRFDLAIAAKYVVLKNVKRTEQAARDADLKFPEACRAFNSVLDVQITEESTPHLYILLRRALADAGLSTYLAKNHYQRKRPFMENGAPICTPKDEAALRKDGSYPSGHTAIGWAWALILTEVFPEKTDAILERGIQFGISRNVCNVHWHSDVIAGRIMGAATVARLHADEIFQADLAAAKSEVAGLMPR